MLSGRLCSGSKFFEPGDFDAPGVYSGRGLFRTWKNFCSRSGVQENKLEWVRKRVHPDDFLLNLLIFFIRMSDPDEFESNLLWNFIRMTLARWDNWESKKAPLAVREEPLNCELREII